MGESRQDDEPVEMGMGAAAVSPTGAMQRQQHWVLLVERMAVGDTDALSRLYDETSGVLFGLTQRILRNSHDAEEALLDAYSRAWRLAGKYSRERGSVLSWLMTMARSIAIDRLRAAKPEGEDLESVSARYVSGGVNPQVDAEQGEQQKRIQSALAQLPEEQRKAIELAFYEGLTHSELAERLGLPLGTVKTRLRLGMGRLRQLLGDLQL
jgi:RNA polymerase sigma-70 factor (ECF subfamily)